MKPTTWLESERSAGKERVTPIRGLAVLVLAAALGTAGFLAVGSLASSTTGTSATVSLRATKLGRVLVSSTGHTLYLFGKDRNGKSACTGLCSQYWPPLLSHGKASAGAGVRASMLGTTRRSNGSLQVTYNRHPLYTFALDKRAGQTNGEANLAFGARWYAVSSGGTAVLKATVTTTSASTTTSPYPTTTSPPYG
jgi:predicted lipoprotein with Yx(FWY)xxD motif